MFLSSDEIDPKKISKIFFYRICGTGMGAAACLLKEKGYDVEGSDSNFYPPMSNYLESTNIPLISIDELSAEKLKSFDLIVVGNVVAKNSKEAKFLEGLDMALASFPSALGALVLNEENVVGIAGTHGKTTTTYFALQVFKHLGLNPGYFIGGVLEEAAPAKLGDKSYFFIESDEYDSAYFEKISKFRLYKLNHLILTSLEFDHADIFASVEDIKDEFKSILSTIDGKHIYSKDYKAINELVREKNLDPIYYGEVSDIGPKVIGNNENITTFKLKFEDNELEFTTNIIGFHNILNLSSIILFALEEGYSYERVKKACTHLKLVKRRQEIRGLYKGAIVIDDFAHHPRAIELTIDALKEKYPYKKLLVVSELNSATARSDIFQSEYPVSFKRADQLILAKPQRPSTVREHGSLDCENVIQKWKEITEKNGCVVSELKQLRELLKESSNSDTIIAILSNGTCLGLWKSDFVDELKKN